MFLFKNLRVYTIGKLSDAFSLSDLPLLEESSVDG